MVSVYINCLCHARNVWLFILPTFTASCVLAKYFFLISMLFLEIHYFLGSLQYLTVVYTLQDSDGDKSDDLVVDVSNEVKTSICVSQFLLENCFSFVCDWRFSFPL